MANAELDVLLFDMADDGPDPGRSVRRAISRLARLEPPPLAASDVLHRLIPVTYQRDLQRLAQCDLVVEAVAESADCKQGILARLAPHVGTRAVLVTTTAELTVGELAQALPEPLRARFCGLQLFTPVRYQPLAELIPGPDTDQRVLDTVEEFVVQTLGKGVVRAKDQPGFVVNRLSRIALALACYHADRLGLAPDVADHLLSTALGAPPQPIYGLIDRLGATVLAGGLTRLAQRLPDDPLLARLPLPPWLTESAVLGGGPVYRCHDGRRLVFDPQLGEFRSLRPAPSAAMRDLLDPQRPAAMWAALHDSLLPGARFLIGWLRDLLHYSACCVGSAAASVREIDLALRWRLGLTRGPFELWQALGWRETAADLRRAIASGQTLSPQALPDWVSRVRELYNERGAYNPASARYVPVPTLSAYRRWLRPPVPLATNAGAGAVALFESAGIYLRDGGESVGVLDLPHSPSAFDDDALVVLAEALAIAQSHFQGLVLHYPSPWSEATPALLAALLEQTQSAAWSQRVQRLQRVALLLRQLPIPVVAVVRGYLAGFGFELAQHCDRIVAGLESYLSPSNPSLGFPLAGGSAAMACRVASVMGAPEGGALLARYARLIGRGNISGSALEARQFALLRPADPVVFNPNEALYVARAQARALVDSGYRPPPDDLCVAGGKVAGEVLAALSQDHVAGTLDEREYRRACQAATVLCGGPVATGSRLAVRDLLALEHQAVLELLADGSGVAAVSEPEPVVRVAGGSRAP